MNGLYVQGISRVILASICSLSFLVVTTKGSAQEYYDGYCQEEEGSNWGKTALVVGGAVIAGAVAGSITGHSNHKHYGCHRHCRRNCELQRNSDPQELERADESETKHEVTISGQSNEPVMADIGNQLIFTFDLGVLLDAESHDPEGMIIPLVSIPDGTIIQGKEITFPFENETISISINDPTFGPYLAGIQVIPNGANVSFELDLKITVETSRDGSETVLIDSEPVMTVTDTDQRQVNVAFTYGQEPIP